MTVTTTVDVVLPCLDEAQALPALLGDLPPGYRAVVVDNGSTDGSARVAREHGATVVTEPRRGFGAAAHAGLLASTADIVAFCDADGSFRLSDLPAVVDPVAAQEADLALGRRRTGIRGGWPLHARVANRALTALIRARTPLRLHDLGPMRAARREQLLALDLQDRRSGYPLEMVLAAATRGWRVREVDVDYLPRVGRSKVTGTLTGTVTAVRDMSRLLAAAR